MVCLLTLNTGSSSVKFNLFGFNGELPLLARGSVSGLGSAPRFSARRQQGTPPQSRELPPTTRHEDAIEYILQWLAAHGDVIGVAGHRIVHGGDKFTSAALLDGAATTLLRALIPLAPLHQPHNLAGVDILRARQPQLRQYGCFDTAFHARRDRLFREFALPADIRARGVQRYGFHGLSYDWITRCLRADHPQLAAGKVVAAHLGNGASLCAIHAGRGVDATMGMTALDGLPMGTRCGAIDPGAMIYMQRALGLSLDALERILYRESGLKGLSGIGNDVAALSLAASDNKDAAFALEYFALKTAQYIAAMAVAVGGMDALVFTGGIGENAENIRAMILNRLAFLPPFRTLVIAADEERAMAIELWEKFGND